MLNFSDTFLVSSSSLKELGLNPTLTEDIQYTEDGVIEYQNEDFVFNHPTGGGVHIPYSKIKKTIVVRKGDLVSNMPIEKGNGIKSISDNVPKKTVMTAIIDGCKKYKMVLGKCQQVPFEGGEDTYASSSITLVIKDDRAQEQSRNM